jgi:hypothetical protein
VRDAGADGLAQIGKWLGQLQLLAGVPFEALVPHPGLLPQESVRFFHVDPNWLDLLLEGALSVGIESSRDQHYQELLKGRIDAATARAAQRVRADLLDASGAGAPAADPPAATPVAGALLRSRVVSGWPGLELNAYSALMPGPGVRPDLSNPILPLRVERLTSEVLLCLWPVVPAIVTLDEPREGVAFGFDDPPPTGEHSPDGLWLYLRSVADGDYGAPKCSDDEIDRGVCRYAIDAEAAGLVDAKTRVVAFGKLADALSTTLGTPLAVRDVAVQLVKVPEQAVFAAPAGG